MSRLPPEGCDIQYRSVITTNRPILFMLADWDDLTPTTPCLELAERMRKAGNPDIERAVYPDVYHVMEWTGGVEYDKLEQNFSACRGFIEPDGSLTLGIPPQPVAASDFWTWVPKNCLTLGAHLGGDYVAKRHLVDDLLAFMQHHGFVRDADIASLLGDCARLSNAYPRLLCERGGGGHIGDIVALGRAFARGVDVPHDEAYAARLFRLAVARGSPHGAFELALFLRDGRGGLTRNPAESVELLRFAADQDFSEATLLLGVAYRSGAGVEQNDTEAARLFRRAALNQNNWALADLGNFYLAGRGGLQRDPAEALRLFRVSALRGNPYGQYSMGSMLERGQAVAVNFPAALDLYRKSAAQEWDGRRDAATAVKRLESAAR